MFTTAHMGYGYMQEEDNSVLDLRVYKEEEVVSGQLTPPREQSTTPPMSALAVTQRVLAAASQPQQGTRPFKAYPKDPLSLTTAQDGAYIRFREEMLAQVRRSGQPRKRPASPPQLSDGRQEEEKDAAYWERRRKNNEAAKRSRDARRAKEDEIAIRAAFLEQENLKLKYQVAALTEETAHLRCMVYKSSENSPIVPIPRFPPMV